MNYFDINTLSCSFSCYFNKTDFKGSCDVSMCIFFTGYDIDLLDFLFRLLPCI